METIRVLVCGSRTFNDYALLERTLTRICAGRPVEIVEGGARGADTLAAKFATVHALIHTQFTADWSQFGKKAGYIRNDAMGAYCEFDICVAFWDGFSLGTKMMIDLAQNKYSMLVHVINFKL